MTALEIYRTRYNEEKTWSVEEPSKLEWVATSVFDLVTYDGDLDERFAKDILEVCKVILEKRNYEYIEDEQNYVKYILVCQLLDKNYWINWGTSIRGAWFEVNESKDILDEFEWWSDKHHVIEGVPFTPENLKALIDFVEEE